MKIFKKTMETSLFQHVRIHSQSFYLKNINHAMKFDQNSFQFEIFSMKKKQLIRKKKWKFYRRKAMNQISDEFWNKRKFENYAIFFLYLTKKIKTKEFVWSLTEDLNYSWLLMMFLAFLFGLVFCRRKNAG